MTTDPQADAVARVGEMFAMLDVALDALRDTLIAVGASGHDTRALVGRVDRARAILAAPHPTYHPTEG